jgi:hypothetical protein
MTRLDLLQVRVIVTDADVLGRIDPAAVAAYLQRAGWVRAHERTGGAIWTRWLDDHAAKLLVPNDPSFGDYAIRMSEVLAALALTQDRSQLAVLVDLCGAASVPSAVERIAAERRRQIEEGGWTAERDDQYEGGELIGAALAYARHTVRQTLGMRANVQPVSDWPWRREEWNPSDDPIRNLVKAAALLAAEIDRLVRRSIAAEVER